MKKIYLPLFLTCFFFPLFGQTIPPEVMHRDYEFLMSDENSKDLSISVEPQEDPYNRAGKWTFEKKESERGTSLRAAQDYETTRDNVFRIKKKGSKEDMLLKTENNLLGIPFLSGKFKIPDEYTPLFHFKEGAERITNQDINQFRVNNWEEEIFFPKTKAIGVPEGTAIQSVYRVPDSKDFIASDDLNIHYYDQSRNEWRKIPVPLYKERHFIDEICAASENVFYVILFERNGTERFITKTEDGGKTWNYDMASSRMHPKEIRFANPNVGYALGEYDEEKLAFYHTLNGGRTWELAYKIQGQKYIIHEVESEGVAF